MEQITIGQIVATVAVLAGLIGGIKVITHEVKKWASGWLSSGLKPIETKLDNLSTHVSEVDLAACKNFLVRFLADVEQGVKIDEVERERFYEVYEHYISPELNGNSYIKDKVEKLKKDGKL